jgi:hypothetical protein
MMKRAILIVVGMLLLATLACGLPGGVGGDEEGTGGNGGEQPPSGESGEQPTPSESGVQPPSGESGEFETAELDQLSSYRLEMTWRVESEDGSEISEMSIVEEWTSDPPARHIVMSGSEDGATGIPFAEMITVEGTSWVLAGDTWMEMPGADEMIASDTWEDFFTDVEEWEYEGQETVNGVNCKHYTSSDETTFTVPDPESGGTASISAEAEIWVADQSDLPPVAVRQWARIEGGFLPFPTTGAPAEGGSVYMEYDLTDINGAITIQPPEGVTE